MENLILCFYVLFCFITKGTQSQVIFGFPQHAEKKLMKIWKANEHTFNDILKNIGLPSQIKAFPHNNVIHEDDKVKPQTADLPNLVDLATQLNLTSLADALKNTSLDNTIDHEGKFTLFAPTNEAFANMPPYAKEETLKDMMKFHVARGMLYMKDLKNEMTDMTLLSKRPARFNVYQGGKVITANGRKVISSNHEAHNGVLHIIHDVIASVYDIGGTVYTEASQSPGHKVFSSAVQKAKLSSLLNEPGPYTLLSPDDRAFKKLPVEIVNYLLKNVTALREVLLYHVVPGTWFTPGLVNGMTLKTLQGKPVSVTVQDGSVKVNNGALIVVDRTAYNGAWHDIDTVLFPPNISSLFVKWF